MNGPAIRELQPFTLRQAQGERRRSHRRFHWHLRRRPCPQRQGRGLQANGMIPLIPKIRPQENHVL